jgi:ribosome-associated heat shock protein Hsp15
VTDPPRAAGDPNGEKVRLDKWLWAARFFKTRSLAARAVSGGKVQLNGRRAKRSNMIRVGDRVRVRKGPHEFQLCVLKLSEKRRPAKEAAALYEETPESIAERQSRARQRKAAPTFSFREGGRPSKKERRELRRLKGEGEE